MATVSTMKTYLILTLVPYPYGGGESFMHQTIAWMQEKGFRCVWVSFARQASQRTTIKAVDDCIFHTFGGYPEDAKFENVYTIYRPDIIHLQGPIVYLALPFFKTYRVSLLVGFHFWTGVMHPNDQGGFDNRDILQHIQEQKELGISRYRLDPICQEEKLFIDFYVASDFINDVITALGGQAIPNVIYPIPPDDHFKASWVDRKYVTIININRGKGGDIFLDIIKEIKDLPFLAICNEPNETKINAQGHRVPDNLDEEISNEINGKVLSYSNVKDIYTQTKILLVPSHVDETFSRVAYEGAASGIPILTTGKGFVKQLLGDAGIYLDPQEPRQWIDKIRELYHNEEALAMIGSNLQRQVARLGDQKPKFLQLVDKLVVQSPKQNIMIFAPWCEQGLGHQAKLYSQLLRQAGYKVHVFSFLSYLLIDQLDNFRHKPEEWLDYDTLYESYNTREEVTERELRQFVISRNIGLCLIPEICFPPIFEKVKILKKLHVRCYAIPNIEICRRDELPKYALFDRVLCNTKQCYNILRGASLQNVDYIGHCLPKGLDEEPPERPPLDGPLKFLHVSGYNALIRKQTMTILEAFREARKILGGQIELTVTFSKNIPREAYAYEGDGITLLTKQLSHDDVLKLYHQHHVSIQVASHEGLGLGFYESLLCETPIISLDQAPHNEVVLVGKSGWLLPSTEVDLIDNEAALVKGGRLEKQDLVTKLTHLASCPQEVAKIQEAIKEEKNHWSQETFIRRLIACFEN